MEAVDQLATKADFELFIEADLTGTLSPADQEAINKAYAGKKDFKGAIQDLAKRAKVTAVDTAPEALLCINRSFILAGFGIPDLREAAPDSLNLDDTFDVVTWTPPFLPGDDADPVRRRQFRGDGGRIRAFLREAPKLLGRGGRLLFPYPDLEAAGWLHAALTDAGLRWTSLVHTKYPVVGPVRLYRAWIPEEGETPGELVSGAALPGAAWVLQDR